MLDHEPIVARGESCRPSLELYHVIGGDVEAINQDPRFVLKRLFPKKKYSNASNNLASRDDATPVTRKL